MQAGEADTAEASAQRELDAVREQFHRELMRKSMRIAELELELERTRHEYQSSVSWRVTAPLRIRSFIRARRAR